MPRPKLHTSVDVFIAIKAFIIANRGMPPTCEELRKILGVRSTRTILRYLRICEADGMIRRWPGARGIALNPRPLSVRGKDSLRVDKLITKLQGGR